MIRQTIAYEATCDCGKGCGEKLFLGARVDVMQIRMLMNGWKIRDGMTVSPGCSFPKKRKEKAKP